MRKTKDFLMVFSAILILCSVGLGLGVLFSKILNYILSFFPESFQLPIIFGTLIVITSIISTILIKKLDNE